MASLLNWKIYILLGSLLNLSFQKAMYSLINAPRF